MDVSRLIPKPRWFRRRPYHIVVFGADQCGANTCECIDGVVPSRLCAATRRLWRLVRESARRFRSSASVVAPRTTTVVAALLAFTVSALAAQTGPIAAVTPGAIDPAVTQANIGSTICKAGYARAHRVPVAVSERLKREQLAHGAYAEPHARLAWFEEDDLISVELGGRSGDPRNLWPEPRRSYTPSLSPWVAETKDRLENELHRLVCKRMIPLAAAQACIAKNWIGCYQAVFAKAR
jgi:hypothetical protein